MTDVVALNGSVSDVRVLVAHVKYRQWGGEDRVVQIEGRLLESAGHDVRLLSPGPVTATDYPALFAALLSGRRVGDAGALVTRAALGEFLPDVVHVHNLFPLLGVGALEAAREASVAVVQTVHNYRYSCLAGTHFREGAICELCGPGCYGSGVRYRCYRGSSILSRMMARMLTDYWRFAVEDRGVATFMVLTAFTAQRFAAAGVEPARIVVKPNSVDAASATRGWGCRSGVVYVGRLSPEKGIARLIGAWSEDLPQLTVVGAGPDGVAVARDASANVRVLGQCSFEETREIIRSARVLVLPSVGYEGGFPLVAMEALSEGTPVVAFDLGSMRVSLDGERAGVLCPVGDFESMCVTARGLARMGENEWTEISIAALGLWAREYGHDANLDRLLSVYRTAG